MPEVEIQELQNMTLAEIAAYVAQSRGLDGMVEVRYTGLNEVPVYVAVALGDAAVLVESILDDALDDGDEDEDEDDG